MTIEFTITNRKSETFSCLVDDEDRDLLQSKWHVRVPTNSRTQYLSQDTRKRNARIRRSFHRIVMERILGRPLLNSEEVDHKDLNGLNNTRNNLRVASSSQNKANTRVRRDNKLGVKGVVMCKGKYHAAIYVDGKNKHLGRFLTIEEAKAAYDKAAKFYYGEFWRSG